MAERDFNNQNQNGAPDLSSLLKAISDNPDMLSQAFSLAAKLKESGFADGLFDKNNNNAPGEIIRKDEKEDKDKDKDKEKEKEIEIEKENESPDAHERDYKQSASGVRSKQRRELLRALRPYLSRDRQDKLDAMLNLSTLYDTASSLGTIAKSNMNSRSPGGKEEGE